MKRLYHGSNLEIFDIDITKGRNYKDFGKGFYLTEIETQAQDWAFSISERRGGHPTITVFDYDESLMKKTTNYLNFELPSKDWAYFIMNNRNRNLNDQFQKLSNQDLKYDIVEGPIGNDTIATLLSQYIMGIIDDEFLVKKLSYKKLNHQVSFHSKSVTSLLKKVDSYEL